MEKSFVLTSNGRKVIIPRHRIVTVEIRERQHGFDVTFFLETGITSSVSSITQEMVDHITKGMQK